jgi:hypothetical protein
VTGRKRAVLQTGNHYVTAFKIIFVVPTVILIFPVAVLYIHFKTTTFWRPSPKRSCPRWARMWEDFFSLPWSKEEKVVEFDFSGERPMPDYSDIRVDPINQVSADLMFYWIGVYMLMAPY